MNEKTVEQAFSAIIDEAIKILEYPDIPDGVKEKIEIILSVSRYQVDIRTHDEKDGF